MPRAPDDVAADKRRLRDTITARRRATDRSTLEAAGVDIAARVGPLLPEGATVAVYAAFAGEPPVAAPLAALRRDTELAWPRAARADRSLRFGVCGAPPTSTGAYGIAEPADDEVERWLAPDEIDAILVPGLAFGRGGSRLGFGGGYYDRFLPQMRPDARRLGVCLSWQLRDDIPLEDHDVPMTDVVTEHEHIVVSS